MFLCMILLVEVFTKTTNVAEYTSFKFIVVGIHTSLLIPIATFIQSGNRYIPGDLCPIQIAQMAKIYYFQYLHQILPVTWCSCIIDQKIAIILHILHNYIRAITYIVLHCCSSSYGSSSPWWLAPKNRIFRKHFHDKLFHSSICWKLNEKMRGKSRTQPGLNPAWWFDHWQKTSSWRENQDSYIVSLSLQELSVLS